MFYVVTFFTLYGFEVYAIGHISLSLCKLLDYEVQGIHQYHAS